MRRYLFYFSTLLVTFAAGSLLPCFEFLLTAPSPLPEIEQSQIASESAPDEHREGIGYGEAKSNLAVVKRGKPVFRCTDESIRPVWDQILSDPAFQEYNEVRNFDEGEVVDCAEHFERKPESIDLNRNGVKEFIIQGKWGALFCGMYSGCWFGIFEPNSDKDFNLLYSHGNVAKYEVGKNIHNGYSDLVTFASGGVYGEYKDVSERRNGKYTKVRCYLTTNIYFDKYGTPQRASKFRTEATECTD